MTEESETELSMLDFFLAVVKISLVLAYGIIVILKGLD